MSDCSILSSVKSYVNVLEDDNSFDTDIKVLINSAFSELNQLGIGPKNGYQIRNESDTWDEYIKGPDPNLNMVQTYVYLHVRLLFDPPSTSFVLDAFKKQKEETAWRLSVMSTTSPESVSNLHGHSPDIPLKPLLEVKDDD